jgi:hypothetical protein
MIRSARQNYTTIPPQGTTVPASADGSIFILVLPATQAKTIFLGDAYASFRSSNPYSQSSLELAIG